MLQHLKMEEIIKVENNNVEVRKVLFEADGSIAETQVIKNYGVEEAEKELNKILSKLDYWNSLNLEEFKNSKIAELIIEKNKLEKVRNLLIQ